MNVAFDIDDTLWKVNRTCINEAGTPEMFRKNGCDFQVPDYDLIQVLRWFHSNGDNVFVWSAGGVEYAKQICRKLGLCHLVQVIAKPPLDRNDPKIDLAFDDSEIGLATVNCLVNRDHGKELHQHRNDTCQPGNESSGV